MHGPIAEVAIQEIFLGFICEDLSIVFVIVTKSFHQSSSGLCSAHPGSGINIL